MWHLWVFSAATPVNGVWMPFTVFISPCQTVALTRGCWSKWKRWSCRASLQQRLGICKVHFNCSARQLRSCLSEPRLITTEHRPCGCEGTQQVAATDSTANHSKQHGVRHIRLSSPSPAWRRIRPVPLRLWGQCHDAASHCGGRVTNTVKTWQNPYIYSQGTRGSRFQVKGYLDGYWCMYVVFWLYLD